MNTIITTISVYNQDNELVANFRVHLRESEQILLLKDIESITDINKIYFPLLYKENTPDIFPINFNLSADPMLIPLLNINDIPSLLSFSEAVSRTFIYKK